MGRFAKRRCVVEKNSGTYPPPECAQCEPYYNSASSDLLARSYIGSRRIVKKEKSMESITQAPVEVSGLALTDTVKAAALQNSG